MSDCGNCKKDWRVQVVDLETGELVLNALPFVSFSFDDMLNQVGPGQVVIPVRKVRLGDVFPHLRALVFLRTRGNGASSNSPVCEGIYMIESLSAVSDGTVTLGINSIEQYLNYRIIKSDLSYTSGQNVLGATLVNLAASNGIPLTGSYDVSVPGTTISRDYAASDDKKILDAITELTQIQNGPDYTRNYTFAAGAWSTDLRFVDYAGDTNPLTINARRGLSSYGVEIDATGHANYVVGRGDSLSPVIVNNVASSIYPQFDKGVQWSDVTLSAQLSQATNGEAVNNADPITTPDVTIADLEIAGRISLGDSRTLKMNHGAIQYAGVARVVGKSWAVSAEAPTTCTLSMIPLDDVAAAILNAPIGTLVGCC